MLIILFISLSIQPLWAIAEKGFARNYMAKVTPYFAKNFTLKHVIYNKNSQSSVSYFQGPTLNKTKTLLIIPGRGEAAEKYKELLYDLRTTDWALVIMDLPGQGRASRFLQDTQIGHLPDIDFFPRSVNSVVGQISSPQRPLSLMGLSTGALAINLFLNKTTQPIEKVFFVSPFFAFSTPKFLNTILSSITDLGVFLGFGEHYFFFQGPYNKKLAFKENDVTFSKIRFKSIRQDLEKTPSLLIGGPSFSWVQQMLLGHKQVRKTNLPMHLFVAKEDTVVDISRAKKYCQESFNCELHELSPARHEILMETDPIRKKVLSFFK